MSSTGARHTNRWSLVVAAGLIVFMAQLDATVVTVALPTIEKDFRAPTEVSQWVVLGYVVPLIALTLLSGRWVDSTGRRHALSIGTAGFASASVLAGLAPDDVLLIAARVVQGAMAALLLALAPVLAVKAVMPAVEGRALSVVSTLAPLGAVSGPLLGGQLVDTVGWRWIFFVNVPVAIAVAALGKTRLPATGRVRPPDVAWLGEALVLGAAAVAILLGLSLAPSYGIGWLLTLCAAPALLAVWGRTQASRPVRRLIRANGMLGPHVALTAAYTALLVVQFLTPFYLTRTLGISVAGVGLVAMAYPAATALVGPLSGALTDRLGPRPVAAGGATILTAGLVATLPLGSDWQPLDVAWRLAALGCGFGLFVTPVQTIAMTLTPRQFLGTTAATTNLARQVGLALGPALATAVWATWNYALSGMRAAVAVAAGAGAVAVFAVLRARPSTSNHNQGDHHVTQGRSDLLLLDGERARVGARCR